MTWLQNFKPYLTLFTNNPVLWSLIVIVLIAMFVLNVFIDRRDQKNQKRSSQEAARQHAMAQWIGKLNRSKRYQQRDHLGRPGARAESNQQEESEEESAAAPISRWAIPTDDDESKS